MQLNYKIRRMRRASVAIVFFVVAFSARDQAADPRILLIKGENLTVIGEAAARDLRATAVLLIVPGPQSRWCSRAPDT